MILYCSGRLPRALQSVWLKDIQEVLPHISIRGDIPVTLFEQEGGQQVLGPQVISVKLQGVHGLRILDHDGPPDFPQVQLEHLSNSLKLGVETRVVQVGIILHRDVVVVRRGVFILGPLGSDVINSPPSGEPLFHSELGHLGRNQGHVVKNDVGLDVFVVKLNFRLFVKRESLLEGLKDSFECLQGDFGDVVCILVELNIEIPDVYCSKERQETKIREGYDQGERISNLAPQRLEHTPQQKYREPTQKTHCHFLPSTIRFDSSPRRSATPLPQRRAPHRHAWKCTH